MSSYQVAVLWNVQADSPAEAAQAASDSLAHQGARQIAFGVAVTGQEGPVSYFNGYGDPLVLDDEVTAPSATLATEPTSDTHI